MAGLCPNDTNLQWWSVCERTTWPKSHPWGRVVSPVSHVTGFLWDIYASKKYHSWGDFDGISIGQYLSYHFWGDELKNIHKSQVFSCEQKGYRLLTQAPSPQKSHVNQLAQPDKCSMWATPNLVGELTDPVSKWANVWWETHNWGTPKPQMFPSEITYETTGICKNLPVKAMGTARKNTSKARIL